MGEPAASSGPVDRTTGRSEETMMLTRRSALVLGFAAATGSRASAAGNLQPYRGPTPAPRDLEVLSLGSQTERRSSAGTPGRVVVINFFATWCGPCMVEMPALDVLADRKLPWLDVICIASGENELVLKRYFRSRRMSPISNFDFPILMDADKSFSAAWGVETLPITFILGPDGIARHMVKGLLDWTQDSLVGELGAIAKTRTSRSSPSR